MAMLSRNAVDDFDGVFISDSDGLPGAEAVADALETVEGCDVEVDAGFRVFFTWRVFSPWGLSESTGLEGLLSKWERDFVAAGVGFLLAVYDLGAGNVLTPLGVGKLDEEIFVARGCLTEGVFGFEGLSRSEVEACSVDDPLAGKVGI